MAEVLDIITFLLSGGLLIVWAIACIGNVLNWWNV